MAANTAALSGCRLGTMDYIIVVSVYFLVLGFYILVLLAGNMVMAIYLMDERVASEFLLSVQSENFFIKLPAYMYSYTEPDVE